MANPTGIRLNEEKLNLVKKNENLSSAQKVVNFLLDKYWWEHKMGSNPVMEIQKASFSQKDTATDDVAETNRELNYNLLIEQIPNIPSIEACFKLDADINKSSLPAWQKTELLKRVKLRSQHEDLN